MSGWGGGYITDIPYQLGWYRQQSPVMMALASIVGGAEAPLPGADDPVTLLELGCGLGYGAMALAASNPAWTVTAVDFNPSHIAGAREWATEAGLTNITFVEADLSCWEDNPAMRAMPEMDFVTMHGLWTWIPRTAQDGIVRLLAKKVRAGGLVHVSYNALPGWQNMIGAARIMRKSGRRLDGRSDQQAREGLRVLNDMIAAEAPYAAQATELAKRVEHSSARYLAHEFMNANWAPCFITDIAAAFSEAKLEWVAASNLAENFPELMLTKPQREIFNRYGDPLMQELIKDMCIPRQLRQDVFVRGARRLNLSERAARLMDVWLTLVRLPEELPESLAMPAGVAELNPEFYRPVVQALHTRAERVGDLLALPNLAGRRDNPAELVSILIGTNMVEPTIRPGRAAGVEAMRFNTVSTHRLMGRESPDRPMAAACLATGMPVVTPLLAMALVDYLRAGITGLDELIRAMNPAAEQETELRSSVENCLNRYIPVLRTAGVF